MVGHRHPLAGGSVASTTGGGGGGGGVVSFRRDHPAIGRPGLASNAYAPASDVPNAFPSPAPNASSATMPSFLYRMANEASAAISDAYGHVVHGDDAGMSAKVVWVVHPTRVPVRAPSSSSSSRGMMGGMGGRGGGGGDDDAGGNNATGATNGGGNVANNGTGASGRRQRQQQQRASSSSSSSSSNVGMGSPQTTTTTTTSSSYLYTEKFGEFFFVVWRTQCPARYQGGRFGESVVGGVCVCVGGVMHELFIFTNYS
jgi:hypothetical protein